MQIKKLADKVFKKYVMIKATSVPAIIRIDISYAIDDIFIDKYAVNIDGEKRRYYVNEVEIEPTLYFNIPIECNGEIKYPVKFQYDVARALINKIVKKY